MRIVIANSKGGCGKSTIALCLARELDADLIDLDHQGTLTFVAEFTGEYMPIASNQITKKHVIYDTPPYHSVETAALLSAADLIIVPVKVSVPDFLATTAIIDVLEKKQLLSKAVIVFNEVRQPKNNTYYKGVELFANNFSIKKSNVELSLLVDYRNVFSSPLTGKAKREILALIEELKIN